MLQTIKHSQLAVTLMSYCPIIIVLFALVVTLMWPIIFTHPTTMALRNSDISPLSSHHV